jgi:hypothetical protein
VAETGSVTEAGRRLHQTQSALSHQLRDAEEKLGTLLLRLGKKMVLTPLRSLTPRSGTYRFLAQFLKGIEIEVKLGKDRGRGFLWRSGGRCGRPDQEKVSAGEINIKRLLNGRLSLSQQLDELLPGVRWKVF